MIMFIEVTENNKRVLINAFAIKYIWEKRS